MVISIILLYYEFLEARENLASPQVAVQSHSRNVCGCADGHHQSLLNPIVFVTCLFLHLLSESMLSTFREILKPLFIPL